MFWHTKTWTFTQYFRVWLFAFCAAQRQYKYQCHHQSVYGHSGSSSNSSSSTTTTTVTIQKKIGNFYAPFAYNLSANNCNTHAVFTHISPPLTLIRLLTCSEFVCRLVPFAWLLFVCFDWIGHRRARFLSLTLSLSLAPPPPIQTDP